MIASTCSFHSWSYCLRIGPQYSILSNQMRTTHVQSSITVSISRNNHSFVHLNQLIINSRYKVVLNCTHHVIDTSIKCSKSAHLSNLASKTISTSWRTDGIYFKAATWIEIQIVLLLYIYLCICRTNTTQSTEYKHWNRNTQNKVINLGFFSQTKTSHDILIPFHHKAVLTQGVLCWRYAEELQYNSMNWIIFCLQTTGTITIFIMHICKLSTVYRSNLIITYISLSQTRAKQRAERITVT